MRHSSERKQSKPIGRPPLDIRGQVYGKLTCVMYVGRASNGNAIWQCLCECGNACNVRLANLRRGSTKSCGCAHFDHVRKHGLSHATAEYDCWVAMRKRCFSENDKSYHRYGGRGIRVCDRWNDFALFLHDMGPRPSPHHSVERIDNNGHYESLNCRWATKPEQNNNTSRTRRITYSGETKTTIEWARSTGIPHKTLYCRLFKYKWNIEKALTQPVRRWPT